VRLYLRATDRRPDPPPIRTNDLAVGLAGTGIWAVLLVAAVLAHGWLTDSGRGWWMWTALAGIVIGLWGTWYVWRRDVRARSATS
jgi:hypothetical protein